MKAMRAYEIFEVFTTGDDKARFEERKALAVYLAECMRVRLETEKRKQDAYDRFSKYVNDPSGKVVSR